MPRGVPRSSLRQRRAAQWWLGRSGRLLLERAASILPPWIERLPADTVLQLGQPVFWSPPPLQKDWILLNDGYVCSAEGYLQVYGRCDALPFAPMRFDLVIVPFCLTRMPDARQILEECWRVLRPEGHILIMDFNPSGSLGMLRRWHLWRRDRNWPWRQPFLPLPQLRRYLEELGFCLRQGRYFQYTFPGLGRSAQWMELVGDRWWPAGANAYILLAQKRESAPTMVGMIPRKKQKFVPKLSTAPAGMRFVQAEKDGGGG
ncbi:class I SAM-dependent methyltransferase [Candidatus Igneacidithiobacillus taiwanensis]|uniref:class I SAM-dependent methyltransferase n=1 Tax=Candidatus Igneacidithiobacillus taiwanensis TaxID=1945924 RepID=UPI00289C281B|nr:methyltransferase domain-containing protein [Candidatus Igneacidithiobacillus taiwanensis]MCE5360262.1 methyltransferase domain-containing protein [Acidithiobacillus sp.]